MTTFSKTDGRATITFEENGRAPYSIYIPTGGIPANVAGVLQAIAKEMGRYSAGELAASFISAIQPASKVRLTDQPINHRCISDAVFVVRYGVGHLVVEAYKPVGSNLSKLYSGSLNDFVVWSTSQTGLEHILNKVVSFKYTVGTHPNTIRVVRVSKVYRKDGEVHVEGWDVGVTEEDWRHASRHYLSSRIDGDITVINAA